jgi:hypothetical protein
MSNKGLGKKRSRTDNDDETLPTNTAAVQFFGMPDVVHHYVSPYLTKWRDHRALACTTAVLWRYYQRHDMSTRIMFFRDANPAFDISKRMHRIFVLDLCDARCMEWLWNQERPIYRVANMAKEFCAAACRRGVLPLVRHYASFVEPPSVRVSFAKKAFATLCKYGRDEAALSLVVNPLFDDHADTNYHEKILMLSEYAHLVPKTFDYLKNKCHVSEGRIVVECLVASCSVSSLSLDAFEWLWTRFVPPSEKKVWIQRFLDYLMGLLENDAAIFSERYFGAIARMPALGRRFFSEFCVQKGHDSTQWELQDGKVSWQIMFPDTNDEVLIHVVFWRENLRMSRALKVPKGFL